MGKLNLRLIKALVQPPRSKKMAYTNILEDTTTTKGIVSKTWHSIKGDERTGEMAQRL